jgi:hypothetical protein
VTGKKTSRDPFLPSHLGHAFKTAVEKQSVRRLHRRKLVIPFAGDGT